MGSILTKLLLTKLLSTTTQIITSDCLEVHNLFSHLEFSCDNCKEIFLYEDIEHCY